MPGIDVRAGDLFAMPEQPYEADDVLQALVAEHLEVLAHDPEDDPAAVGVVGPTAASPRCEPRHRVRAPARAILHGGREGG
jgi:hypothetical protein